MLIMPQRLAGACLLIFANKTDVDGCMTEAEILQVGDVLSLQAENALTHLVASVTRNSDTSMAHSTMQCHDWEKPQGRIGVGCRGRQEATVFILGSNVVGKMRVKCHDPQACHKLKKETCATVI